MDTPMFSDKGGKKGKKRWMPNNRADPLGGGKGFKGDKGGKKGKKGDKKGDKGDNRVVLIADVLNLVVEKYARMNGGLMDCSSVVSMEELKKYSPNMSTDMWARIVAKTVKDSKTCTALSLDNNNIKQLYSLASHLQPELQLDSLSLKDNHISSIEDIRKLEPLQLKHLCLEGNPIYKADPQLLYKSLKKALPSLLRIDSTPVDRSSVIDTLPQVPGGIDEANPMQATVKGFMDSYFSTTAKNSADDMLDFYDSKAVMSLTLDDKFKLGSGVEGGLLIRSLRSVARCRHGGAGNVFVGKLNVGKCLEALMKAKATYDGSTILQHTEIGQVSGTLLGSTQFPLPALVTVTMHGVVSFPVSKVDLKKYFDRTWLLAVKNGAPIIVNDMLHLRETHAKLDPVFKNSQMQVYYGLHMRAEDNMVVQLSSMTGLSLDCSRACLEQKEAGPWNLAKAQESIQKKMAEGALTQTHFANEKEPKNLTTMIFSKRTNLKPDKAYMCLEVPEVNFDLMKGWELFLARQGKLDASMFMS